MRTLALMLLMPLAASAVPPPRIALPDLQPPAPAEELKDPAELADRIAKNSKSVSDRLADAKTEKETLRDQKQVKDDLDTLIKLLEPPSPPPPNAGGGGSGKNDPPPSGSGGSKGNPPPNQGNKGGSQGNPPPPNQDKGESQGNPPPKQPAAPQPPRGADPKAASAGGQPGEAKAAASLPSLPPEESLARDFWGNLPDAPRQQMMQFYREQYMTKYKDLLSQYYQSLAEKEKKK